MNELFRQKHTYQYYHTQKQGIRLIISLSVIHESTRFSLPFIRRPIRVIHEFCSESMEWSGAAQCRQYPQICVSLLLWRQQQRRRHNFRSISQRCCVILSHISLLITFRIITMWSRVLALLIDRSVYKNNVIRCFSSFSSCCRCVVCCVHALGVFAFVLRICKICSSIRCILSFFVPIFRIFGYAICFHIRKNFMWDPSIAADSRRLFAVCSSFHFLSRSLNCAPPNAKWMSEWESTCIHTKQTVSNDDDVIGEPSKLIRRYNH